VSAKTPSSRIVLVHRNASFVAALALALACSACAKRVTARVPVQPVVSATETGNASWYGDPYHGRRAASGEIYDMEQFTAAHRTLPFQTWVEVTNLSNGRQVAVRINDRGPFVDGRIIDLSLAAARAVDMVRAGVAPVRLRIVSAPQGPLTPPVPAAASYTVQAGAFADQWRAENFRDALPFPDVRVVPSGGDPPLWRVLVGSTLNMDAATDLALRVKEVAGDSLVVRDGDGLQP
jgi:rare lipoprotein A